MSGLGRVYWFAALVLFLTLVVTSFLPTLPGIVLLIAALYAGSFVVEGRWEVPGVSAWLRNEP